MTLYRDILEALGLSRLALRSYTKRIRRNAIRYRDDEIRKSRFDWIERYEAEENRGVELLQRRRRLEEERESLITNSTNTNGDPLKDNPPTYEYTSIQHTQQLEEIYLQYQLHRKELEKIEAEKPVPSYIIERWELLRRSKNFQGRTLAWVRDSQACALRGGCCGRGCGCCDKPLREFLMPTGGFRGKKKLSAIYGHCTAECSCCIRSPGFYQPNTAERTKLSKLAQAWPQLGPLGPEVEGIVEVDGDHYDPGWRPPCLWVKMLLVITSWSDSDVNGVIMTGDE